MNNSNNIFTLTIFVILGLILSVVLLNEHKKNLYDFHSNSHELLTIPEDIKYYDEVLTMSAYMAVLTHDSKWIERYNNADIAIVNTILKAKKKFPNIKKSLDEIETLGKVLIDLERKSFDLIKQKRFTEAHDVLFDKNYNKNKSVYTDTLDNIIKDIENSIVKFEDNAEKKFEFLILVINLIIAIIIIFGILIYAMFNRQNKNLKKSEESLNNQYKLLEKIVDSVPVRMFWKDKDGLYLGANQLLIDDAQLNFRSEIIGKNDFDMPWKKDAKRFRDDDAAVISSGVPRLQYEENLAKEDGSFISLLTSKVPLRDIHDNVIGVLGIYDNITEQKRVQKEQEEQEELLFKQAKHAQMGEMIAMIAHQWRQPLAAIAATVASLHVRQELQGYDKEYYNQQLNSVDEYTQHLSKTIDDFRNFFKDEKQKVPTTLENIVEDSLSIIGSILESEGIELKTVCLDNRELLTYPNELKQVVINILKNAQEVMDEKYIIDPKIEIKISYKNEKYYLEISDNAGGIAEDILNRIFEPYFTTKGELNGTGLGLYMSKTIIEDHMNGKLHAKNIDDGACFTIEIDDSNNS